MQQSSGAMGQEPNTKTGVLLVNTGTPDSPTPDAVRVYLKRFLSDPRIAPIPLPIWNIILKFCILGKRSITSANKYAAIWTDAGSPLEVTHCSIVEKLNTRFHEQGKELIDDHIVVTYAMSYSSPFIDEGLKSLKDAGCNEIIVLPLYPQGAYSTVGVVQDKVAAASQTIEGLGALKFIDHYHDQPGYIEALAESVKAAGFNAMGSDRLVCSYHSIPLKDVEQGDTYVDQVRTTTQKLTKALGVTPDRVDLLFQSRFDKRRTWQGPFLRQTLDQWASAGVNENLFIICPNFSVDCLETLNEIKNEIIPAFEQANATNGGKGHIVYIPCLNDSAAGIEVIAGVIENALR